MALTYGFYNSVNHDRKYDALQFSSLFDGLIADGVFATIGNALQVAPNSGMDIKIRSGRAWFNHTWSYNDSDYVLTVDAPEVVLSRKDAVVLEIDSSTGVRANSFKMVRGTPASTPQPPVMTHTNTVNQYPLAYITVTAGTTEITASKIESTRGTASCPFVTGIINTIDISNLSAQWQAQFNEWMEENEDEYSSWSTAQRADFDQWFADIRIELDENVAALLLEKCRLLKEVRYILLQQSAWTLDSSGLYRQTVTTDMNGLTLTYDVSDNPVLVDGYEMSTGRTPSAMQAYYKNFSILSAGTSEYSSGGYTFYVRKLPDRNFVVGLKGV